MSSKFCPNCGIKVDPDWSVQGNKQKCEEAVKWIMIQMLSYGEEVEDLLEDVQDKFGVRLKFNCPQCKKTI